MEMESDTDTGDAEASARRFMEVVPHADALGMEIVMATPGCVEVAMPWAPEFVGDPRTGVLHGGVISALMDMSCGLSVLCHPSHPPVTATIDLRIDYLRSATPGQRVSARAECFHVTRSVAFVRAVARDEGDTPVATATGAFTVGV